MENQDCVNCGFSIGDDSEVQGSDAQPSQGDFTICLVCGQPYVYVENPTTKVGLVRHPLTQKQFRAMPMTTQKIIRDAWEVRRMLIEEAQKKTGKPL